MSYTPPSVTPNKLLPGMEAWQLPAAVLPEIPNPTTLETSQIIPKFLEIRRSLAERALGNVEVKYLKEVRHDTVIRAAAMSAQLQHGFYKGLPAGTIKTEPLHIVPTKHSERITSGWRNRQDKKRRKLEHEGHNVASLYESSLPYTDFLPDDFAELPLEKQNWATMQAKLKATSVPKRSTFNKVETAMYGTRDEYGRIDKPPVGMPASTMRMHQKNDRLHADNHGRADMLQHSLDRGAAGMTWFGARRRSKIDKIERKMVKTQRKVDNFDRLAYVRDVNTERARDPVDYARLNDIQYEFGQKWADDIHRQMTRTEHGRQLIADKAQFDHAKKISDNTPTHIGPIDMRAGRYY